MIRAYPVHHTKSSLFAEVLARYVATLFVETGTNTGHGVQTALDVGFGRVVTIEADPVFWRIACDRFREDSRVSVLLGSSAVLLTDVASKIVRPATFYLDAHSAESNPLLDELSAIAMSPCATHTILIDDVRMFGTPDWHGLSEDDALDRIYAINPKYRIAYADTYNAANDLLVATVGDAS